MNKEKRYTTTLQQPDVWTKIEKSKPYIRLVGPGLDFHSVYEVDEENLKVILRALEDAYEAGRRAKGQEICRVIGAAPFRY